MKSDSWESNLQLLKKPEKTSSSDKDKMYKSQSIQM